jgi:hypothetical protein
MCYTILILCIYRSLTNLSSCGAHGVDVTVGGTQLRLVFDLADGCLETRYDSNTVLKLYD